MQVAYRLTANDLVEAQRRHGGWWKKLEPVWGLCLLAAGVVSLVFNPNQFPVAVVLIGLGLFVLFGWKLLIRRAFRQDHRLQQPFEAVVSDAGIDISSSTGSSQHKWSAFIRYVETKNLFVVYHAPNMFNIFPKRAFLLGEEGAVRDLLSSKLGAASAAHDKKIGPKTLIFWSVVIVSAILLWMVIRSS